MITFMEYLMNKKESAELCGAEENEFDCQYLINVYEDYLYELED